MLNQKKQNYKCPDNKMNHLNNVDEFKIIIVFFCVSSQIFFYFFCCLGVTTECLQEWIDYERVVCIRSKSTGMSYDNYMIHK